MTNIQGKSTARKVWKLIFAGVILLSLSYFSFYSLDMPSGSAVFFFLGIIAFIGAGAAIRSHGSRR